MNTTDRFTHKAQEALAAAQSSAQGSGHGEVGSLHLLAALLGDPQSITATLLKRTGADPQRIATICDAQLKRLPTVSGAGSVNLSRELGAVIAAAGEQLTLNLGAFDSATLDVDDLAVAVRRESDGLRFLQVHANLA